jgi:hypothetical protein
VHTSPCAGRPRLTTSTRAPARSSSASVGGLAQCLELGDDDRVQHRDEHTALRAVVDDTLMRRSGRKVFGAGWHHDPLAAGRGRVAWANNWVVAGILVDLPFLPHRSVCLPVLARLWQPKHTATRLGLAVELVTLLAQHHPDRAVHLIADAAYAGKTLQRLPANVTVTVRRPAPLRAVGRRVVGGLVVASPAQPDHAAGDGELPASPGAAAFRPAPASDHLTPGGPAMAERAGVGGRARDRYGVPLDLVPDHGGRRKGEVDPG